MAEALTITISLLTIFVALRRPVSGLILIIITVYFPIFAILNIGPLAISVSTLPVLVLFVSALQEVKRDPENVSLPAWMSVLLVSMAIGFILAALTGSILSLSFSMMLNLLMYVMILFFMIVFVRQAEDFTLIAKVLLVLILIDALVPGLRPIQGALLGTWPLGINGLVFKHYQAFALGLVFFTQPVPGISRGWRLFGVIVSISSFVRAILFQTRSAWIAMAVITVLLLLRLPHRRVVLAAMIVLVGLFGAVQYGSIIEKNFTFTQRAFSALTESNNTLAESGDQMRLIASQFAWDMFLERPALGWGPGTFWTLSRSNTPNSRYVTGSAFNSWLVMLFETGLVGTLPVLAIWMIPILVIWFRFGRWPPELRYLAIGFGIGTLGTVIHMLLIDLLFTTQAWVHLGLCLAIIRTASNPSHPHLTNGNFLGIADNHRNFAKTPHSRLSKPGQLPQASDHFEI